MSRNLLYISLLILLNSCNAKMIEVVEVNPESVFDIPYKISIQNNTGDQISNIITIDYLIKILEAKKRIIMVLSTLNIFYCKNFCLKINLSNYLIGYLLN